MKQKAIVIDIDNTLTYNLESWAAGHLEDIKKGNFDWFHEGSPRIPCLPAARPLLQGFLDFGVKLIFISARSRRIHRQTKEWIYQHLGLSYKDFVLYTIDYNSEEWPRDSHFKEFILTKKVLPKYEVILALDDLPGIVEMYRRYKIPVARIYAPEGELEPEGLVQTNK